VFSGKYKIDKKEYIIKDTEALMREIPVDGLFSRGR
jgi:hypothetical protein